MCVLDASVVMKWFVEEDETEKALFLREAHIKGDFTIVAPDILLYEVANALNKGANFSEEEVHECLQDIYDIMIDIVAPLPNIVHPSIRLMCEREISFYDAFYVALAYELGLRFITADEKLYKKVKDLPFVQLLKDLEM
ncbi:type II toxin-antitoxin system VapC family toxin [bacterium]|nr:type II toxin-antitoxin system VapC family toxin [bacterium]MBU1599943.1 type II toxin-antitoxin system VapC family toxin [bacterium]